VVPHPPYFSFFPIEDKTERHPIWKKFRLSRQNRRLWWTPSQNTTSRINLKMAEALGKVHTRGREQFRGCWWSVDLKLIFDQMTAPVPEIMDGSLYISPCASRPSMGWKVLCTHWLTVYRITNPSHRCQLSN
jgi:hypothetical protein